LIDLKTRAVAPFFPDARTLDNIYKLVREGKYISQLLIYVVNYLERELVGIGRDFRPRGD
jgi:hypothetical protein